VTPAWPSCSIRPVQGDSLCVVRFDRLGRSLKELLETIGRLRARQIDLISLEEKIDTTSAAELVFHVFSAIAHFERRPISERTTDGLVAARKRGRKPGRPRMTRTPSTPRSSSSMPASPQVKPPSAWGSADQRYRIASARADEPVSSSSVQVYRKSDSKP
jgi:hypothetical protein